jgi:hypothetical protein
MRFVVTPKFFPLDKQVFAALKILLSRKLAGRLTTISIPLTYIVDITSFLRFK